MGGVSIAARRSKFGLTEEFSTNYYNTRTQIGFLLLDGSTKKQNRIGLLRIIVRRPENHVTNKMGKGTKERYFEKHEDNSKLSVPQKNSQLSVACTDL